MSALRRLAPADLVMALIFLAFAAGMFYAGYEQGRKAEIDRQAFARTSELWCHDQAGCAP